MLSIRPYLKGVHQMWSVILSKKTRNLQKVRKYVNSLLNCSAVLFCKVAIESHLVQEHTVVLSAAANLAYVCSKASLRGEHFPQLVRALHHKPQLLSSLLHRGHFRLVSAFFLPRFARFFLQSGLGNSRCDVRSFSCQRSGCTLGIRLSGCDF